MTVDSMGSDSGADCVRPHRRGYLFVIQQLTEPWHGCQDPGKTIYQIVPMGYTETCG